jgi:UDPglucose 6-dehydrogenase
MERHGIKMKIKIGIIGCGVIGGALRRWISEHNPDCKLLVSDPAKGFTDDVTTADIFFISIHIPTEHDDNQNLNALKEILKTLPDKPVFIRTTLLPGTSDLLRKELNKNIFFMPEFLSERTAYENFCSQPMIFCGEIDLLKKIFIGKEYITMTSLEAEIAKYAHNVFGALKVTFFNGIYELAAKSNSNYKKIREGLLLSGYINETHTLVPGHDNKFGYGGKCFPKDVDAFAKFTEESHLGEMIELVRTQNEYYREKS